jgi:hypothetical protein
MKIRAIVGAETELEHTAVEEFVAAFRAGKYTQAQLHRLPRGRVEVHIESDVGGVHAVIVIEDGMLYFEPPDSPGPSGKPH